MVDVPGVPGLRRVQHAARVLAEGVLLHGGAVRENWNQTHALQRHRSVRGGVARRRRAGEVENRRVEVHELDDRVADGADTAWQPGRRDQKRDLCGNLKGQAGYKKEMRREVWLPPREGRASPVQNS